MVAGASLLEVLVALHASASIRAAEYITIQEIGQAPLGKCVTPDTKVVMEPDTTKQASGKCASHRCEEGTGFMQVVTSTCPTSNDPRARQKKCTNPSLPYPKCCPGAACS